MNISDDPNLKDRIDLVEQAFQIGVSLTPPVSIAHIEIGWDEMEKSWWYDAWTGTTILPFSHVESFMLKYPRSIHPIEMAVLARQASELPYASVVVDGVLTLPWPAPTVVRLSEAGWPFSFKKEEA